MKSHRRSAGHTIGIQLTRWVAGVLLCCLVSVHAYGQSLEATDASLPVRFEATAKTVKVMLGDQHFTTLHQFGFDKPILYPVFGPGQVPMVRNWPMKPDVAGEAHDHPHHKSIWYSHEINGVDFWTEKEGRVFTKKVKYNFKEPAAKNAVRLESEWLRKSDGALELTTTTTYQFGGTSEMRWIDCTIEFHASEKDVEMEDTKEGVFAIRTHPDLRLKPNPKQGVKQVFGSAFNSEGVSGKAIWGKKAKWLVYQGKVDDRMVSVALFDHPDNLRHPTTWHARDYGLVAANPFGLKHFLGEQDGSGRYTIPKGQSLKLKYRISFSSGKWSALQAETQFQKFAKPIAESK